MALLECGGFIWPDTDVHCRSVIFGELEKLEEVIALCPNKRVAIQAGGNVGVFPKRLATAFDQVYTFEPDQANFECLCLNVPEHNVFKFPAALGNLRGAIDLKRDSDNVGAHFIHGEGPIPTIAIDDLSLGCDLLYLDIEGYEWRAIAGAMQTIRFHRPVVAFEDKGLSEKYGKPKGFIEELLKERLRYQVHSRPGRDVVMVPG